VLGHRQLPGCHNVPELLLQKRMTCRFPGNIRSFRRHYRKVGYDNWLRGVKGKLDHYEEVTSKRARTRTVEVWTPPGYEKLSDRTYPVIYMHDGQNLFEARHSFSGVSWGMDEAVVRSMEKLGHDGVIIVGIWNTPDRIPEYMPQRPLERIRNFRIRSHFARIYGGHACSDDYLWFIVNELKPSVDRHYRTRSGARDTFMMGSSMGGLFTVYAFCEHPEVFSSVACLSTSWTVGGNQMLTYLHKHIPEPDAHRVYFDYGVEAFIGAYDHIQHQADNLFRIAGYRPAEHTMTRHFPGASHSEDAWRHRVDVPLEFLLAPGTNGNLGLGP